MNSILRLIVALLLTGGLAAQGKIAGKIQDASDGEPLIGCNVILKGTKYGASTDLDGNFVIFNVPQGTYTVDFTYISYERKQVELVHVTDGLTTTLHISLKPEAIEGEEIVIEARASRNQETGLLLVQKKSSKVMDGISSEQIGKTSDGNAGAALKRVTGVSIVGGKDVYVRGLGNRYSNVQLNGSTLPSTNPNQKEAPLDIFSSNVVDNIVVQKTYTADQPGEFSGGSVQISTKEFPDQRTIRVGVSSSYNTLVTGRNYLGYSGGKMDWLGYDDGSRKLPDVADNGRISQTVGANAVKDFQNVWSPRTKSSLPGQGYSLSYGDIFEVGENRQLGVVATGSYSYSNSVQNGVKGTIFQPNSFASLYNVETGKTSAMVSGMVNVFYKLNGNSKIGLKNLYSNTADNSASTVQGYYYNAADGSDYRQTVIQFQQRTITASNLSYDTYIKDFMDSKLLAEVSYSTARAYQPDTRNTHYAENVATGNFEPIFDLRGNYHFFSDQQDRDVNYRVNWDFKAADKLRLKVGGLVLDKNRDFEARRFVVTNDPSIPYPNYLKDQGPEVAFADSLFDGKGLLFYENTRNSDSYKGDQQLYAGYVSSEWKVTPKVDLVVGARVENSVQKIDGNEVLSTTDVLPSLNATYRLKEDQNIRVAFAITLARPEFREISNFFFADFVGSRTIFGNPDLKRTKIFNYDLRWEVFPGIGEMLSVSAFYKRFQSPIELFHRLSGNPEVYYGNVKSANLYGLELEGRKTIIDQLRMTGNLTLIASDVHYSSDVVSQAKTNRPMYGQSPYTINLNLFYTLKIGTEFNVAYNRFGKRISSVGNLNQQDDEYEMPFDKLDFTVSQKVNNYTFKLNAQNLLNDNVVYKQAGLVTNRYRVGLTYSLGVTYDF